MDIINREDIRKLVEVFYQPSFKIFYVNTADGVNFVKPIGVFVSLGITTSIEVLKNIKDILDNTPEYSAKIVELSSTKVSGQFMNQITKDNPEQIFIEDIESAELVTKIGPGEEIMDQSKAMQELESLKNFMHPDQDMNILYEYAPRIGKLQELIDKLNRTDGWSSNWIHKKSNSEYKLYHRKINYINCGDVEYRIGIFVSPK